MTERKRNKFSRHDSIKVMEEKIKASLEQKSRFTGHGMTDTEAGYLLFSLSVINILIENLIRERLDDCALCDRK